MEKLLIIKIGGNIIDNETELQSFLRQFAQLPGKKLLVHGGGKLASEMSKSMGITPQMVNGRRITDEQTLKIVCMVYAGWINKNIVAQLQALKCNAIGLSGADGLLIPAEKRKKGEVDYGLAGDVIEEEINTNLLKQLLNTDMFPVIAPITCDEHGQLLNTNADTIASSLAVALSSHFYTQLLYCFEKKGVLMNIGDEDSYIRNLNMEQYEQLKEDGIIAAGMIPKLDNAFHALTKGVSMVTIAHHNELNNIAQKQSYAGTNITLN